MSAARFLGLDVGGTATRWAVADAAGTVAARGEAGGATGHVFRPEEHARFAAMLAAVAAAAGPVDAVALGVTGYGAPVEAEIRALAAAAFAVAPDRIHAMDDVELAYAAVFAPGEGHLVVAGTGSIGLSIAADGTRLRVGGRGILIDDGGGGAWIALRALSAVFRRIDLTGRPDGAEILAETLRDAVGGPPGDELWLSVRPFVYGGERGGIGTLAAAVAAAARRGDATALAILEAAGEELAGLAQVLLARAGPRPVAVVGRVPRLHACIAAAFARRLPGVAVTYPEADAALAAARLARTIETRTKS
jgi:N-acetylglucosamine kinase-like BadF-type ATPase